MFRPRRARDRERVREVSLFLRIYKLHPIYLPEVREFIKDTRPKTNTTIFIFLRTCGRERERSMHESDHDQKPSRKRKCRIEQRAHAHTISETRERISNNGDAHSTHTRHERSRSMQQKERAKIAPLPATAAVSVAICRQADRLRRARGSLVLVGWLHQSCIIAASRMLGSHGATPRWPDRSGRRARPGLARTPAAGSGSSGERPRRTRTPHRRTWCSQRCSPRP